MNKLTQFLNAMPLAGDWHFAQGTRFDQTAVTIDFDNPGDLSLAQDRYRASRHDQA